MENFHLNDRRTDRPDLTIGFTYSNHEWEGLGKDTKPEIANTEKKKKKASRIQPGLTEYSLA